MRAVGKAANHMVEEIRRQFREIPGILEGKNPPDAARCVEISTNGSLKHMIAPGLMAVAIPVAIGKLFGAQMLGGLWPEPLYLESCWRSSWPIPEAYGTTPKNTSKRGTKAERVLTPTKHQWSAIP